MDLNPFDGTDDLGINDAIDAVSDLMSDLVGSIVPDWELTPDLDGGGDGDLESFAADFGSGSDNVTGLPNDGFYESLPGIDAGVGQMLDQTYEMLADADELGTETFGEEEWAASKEWAASDPYGLAAGIESPSELQLRFAQEDAAADRDFMEWRDQRDTIADAQAEAAEADRVLNDADWLEWDTDNLLRFG